MSIGDRQARQLGDSGPRLAQERQQAEPPRLAQERQQAEPPRLAVLHSADCHQRFGIETRARNDDAGRRGAIRHAIVGCGLLGGPRRTLARILA